MSVFYALQREPLMGLVDIVPTYNSVTLIFDNVSLISTLPQAQSIHDFLWTCIEKRLSEIQESNTQSNRKMDVPVCYDESVGSDLAFVASHNKLAIQEVIEIHTASLYKVYMLGFLPGFAYMATVDERIVTPRKQIPSQNILPGSVGIAGIQTGIYPVTSPGGWQIIGQTPLQLFNAQKESPTFFQPGDAVKFYPISLHEFHKMKEA
jgi:inhibitor of KinA